MSKRIYIVDDDYFVRRALTELIRIYLPSATIRQIESGKQCLQFVMAQTPHIIFLDSHMPEMDGLETAVALAEQSTRQAFLLVGMADVGNDGELLAQMRSLCDAWLQKPFTLRSVSDILDQSDDTAAA